MNKIGIIGFGNMGSCLAQKMNSGEDQVWVFDKDIAKTSGLTGIELCDSNNNLARSVDTIILAVKPQDIAEALEEIKSDVGDKLVISIAAGISTSYIEKFLNKARVIRTMPNMPVSIGQGATCLCKGKFASEEDLEFAKKLFDKMGSTLILEEKMLNEATAISGSGPGYVFDWFESKKIDRDNDSEIERFREEFTVLLTGAAVGIGFLPQDAAKLAKATVDGSIALFKQSELSASELKKQITSKGGTTEAALAVLHSGGGLIEAVKAAVLRAKELSKS